MSFLTTYPAFQVCCLRYVDWSTFNYKQYKQIVTLVDIEHEGTHYIVVQYPSVEIVHTITPKTGILGYSDLQKGLPPYNALKDSSTYILKASGFYLQLDFEKSVCFVIAYGYPIMSPGAVF